MLLHVAASGREPAVEYSRDVDLSYGEFVAVDTCRLAFRKGSFVTLLGPSGCGKTTILRSIAGLVDIRQRARSIVAGRRINDVPIHKRNIGLVFQNYALFPHKTRLRQRRLRPEIPQRAEAPRSPRKVRRALDMVRLPGSREEAAVATVGRPAAAHRARPRHRHRARRAAARRAAFGARCQSARGDARRDQEHPAAKSASPPSS